MVRRVLRREKTLSVFKLNISVHLSSQHQITTQQADRLLTYLKHYYNVILSSCGTLEGSVCTRCLHWTVNLSLTSK